MTSEGRGDGGGWGGGEGGRGGGGGRERRIGGEETQGEGKGERGRVGVVRGRRRKRSSSERMEGELSGEATPSAGNKRMLQAIPLPPFTHTHTHTHTQRLRMRVKAMQQVIDSQTERIAALAAEKEAVALGHHDESTGQGNSLWIAVSISQPVTLTQLVLARMCPVQ